MSSYQSIAISQRIVTKLVNRIAADFQSAAVKRNLSITCFLVTVGCWLITVHGYAQPTVDTIIDPKLATVLLYPQLGSTAADPARTLNVPVLNVDDQVNTPLVLEFDDLTAIYRNFRAKVIHCNADWKRSVLNDVEFTYEYNDNPITEYQVSVSTKVAYYHYQYAVPRMKLPGNYVLVVYNEQNRSQVLFTRRFRLYAQRVQVQAGVRFSTDVSRQYNDQQVELTIDYKAYQAQVTSPQDDFRVIIRQNFRDDRTVTNLRPTNVRSFDQVLEYRAIDLRNTFPGGNEYRYFDTRTLFSRANYIEKISRLADKNVAYVQAGKPRSGIAYTQFDDFNGLFVIDHLESHNGSIEADYTETIFTLLTDELPGVSVYANGAFNFWALNDRNRLTYDGAVGGYRGTVWLKQGVYNYDFSVTGVVPPISRSGVGPTIGNESLIEGDFSQTENDYEVFVYQRPPASRADQLVGYRQINYGKRK